MRNKHKKIISLLLVAWISVYISGTALAQVPDGFERLYSVIWNSGSVCADNSDQGSPSTSSLTDTEALDVMLQKGELKLYNAENEQIALIKVAEDGDAVGIVVSNDLNDEAGKVVFQKTNTQLLRTAEIDGTEIKLVPIRLEYVESSSERDAFDAYIDLHCIVNFDELVLAYQEWYPAIPEITPDPLYTEISTKLSKVNEGVNDIFEETKTLSSSIEELILSSKLELYQLIGIGTAVLLATTILILLLTNAKTNREKLQALKSSAEVQNRSDQQIGAAVSDISKYLYETTKGTAQVNEQLTFIVQSLDNINRPKPPVDHMKVFLEQANGATAVNAPDQWYQQLLEYRPEFLKYDAIQRWFSREGGIGDPLFAVCSVPSSNGSQLCLIPSCYDTMLASGDLPIAYDVIKPTNGESIRTYKIDRVAVLEPYGVYFRVVSRGQITLLS